MARKQSLGFCTYVPVQTLNLLHLIHAMPPVTAALHGCCHTMSLELGLQIIQAQLHMPQPFSFYPQLQHKYERSEQMQG